MKRLLGIICMLALFGMISVRDPLFGLFPSLRPQINRQIDSIQDLCTQIMDRLNDSVPDAIDQGNSTFAKKRSLLGAYGSKGSKRLVNRKFISTSSSAGLSISKDNVWDLITYLDRAGAISEHCAALRDYGKKACSAGLKSMQDMFAQSSTPFEQSESYSEQLQEDELYDPEQECLECSCGEDVDYKKNEEEYEVEDEHDDQELEECICEQEDASELFVERRVQGHALRKPRLQPRTKVKPDDVSASQWIARSEKQLLLKKLLKRLESKSDYEVKQSLRLLNAECSIIECLLQHQRGQILESKVALRNKLMKKSPRSTARLHALMVDLSSPIPTINPYQYAANKGERLQNVRGGLPKKEFLMHMMVQIEKNYRKIKSLQ